MRSHIGFKLGPIRIAIADRSYDKPAARSTTASNVVLAVIAIVFIGGAAGCAILGAFLR